MQTPTRIIAALAAALAGLGLVSCGAQIDSVGDETDSFELSEIEMIENGAEIVETQCSFCHAVGVTGQSPRADAPPLRTVLADYPADVLAEDFREQVHVGHPDMPDFNFGPIGTDHVLAYLQSIQDPEAGVE